MHTCYSPVDHCIYQCFGIQLFISGYFVIKRFEELAIANFTVIKINSVTALSNIMMKLRRNVVT